MITLVLILIGLWLLGFITKATAGGLLHLLLLAALVLFVWGRINKT